MKEKNPQIGINNYYQLSNAEDIITNNYLNKLMEKGVKIVKPNTVYIEDTVEIEENVCIMPGNVILGNSFIITGTFIGENNHINNSSIGENTKIYNSYIEDSKIGNNAIIGPFARLRNNCIIGANAKIGNFVEIKNSIIGKNTKCAHLSYLGDSEIGENINIGCGVVTVNYDGKEKHKTIIKDKAFIGCNVNLIAPITVGENAFVAAGSTINKDVPKNALAIARSYQTNKENYIKSNQKN